VYVDQRQAILQSASTPKNAGFPSRSPRRALPDLDRKTANSWIALVALSLLVTLATACSGVDEGAESSQWAIAEAGRWKLPATVLTAGAKVRLDYDEAPKWTTTAACGTGLKVGGAKLGTYLRGKFAVISSVGGFACRRNTADTSRMSVHGTGRALDIFVPRTGGAADNGQGDKIANWLVTNAQRIGVQLVIWDRTIWRANGTNDSAYGGPHPHDDHLHVELTNLAGTAKTAWFLDMTDGDDAGASMTADAGTDTTDTTDTDTDTDADAGTTTQPTADSGADAAKDAGPSTDAGQADAAPTEPDDTTEPPPGPGTPKGDTLPGEPPSDESDYETEDDGPGETDSLSDSPSANRRSSSTLEDAPMPNAGCSAAPSGAASHPVSAGGFALAFALGLAGLRRRKGARRD
jgi:hypothetical protein